MFAKKQIELNKFHLLFFACLFNAIFINGCASYNTEQFSIASNTIAKQKQIKAPFFPQEQYHCGPAALASVFNFYGVNSSPDELAKQIFIPEKKGSLQIEIIAASRRAEFLPYQLNKKFEEVLIEVNAGHPVLVLQNLSFSWLPKWHYAVVVGYDLNKQTLILHSGRHENYQLSFRTFLATWNRANNWALVIVPLNTMPASVEQNEYLKAATSLETTGHKKAAFQAYQQALNFWPDNEIALFGIGNYFYEQSDYEKSVEVFLHLVQAHPSNPAAWNNFAYALQKNNCSKQAQQAINKAISLAHDTTPYLSSQQDIKQITYSQNNNNAFCDSISFTSITD